MVQLPGGVTADSLFYACLAVAFTLWLARFLSRFLSRVSPLSAAAMAEAAEAPPPEPVHCGELTLEALRAFDGSDPTKPLYLVRRGAALSSRPLTRRRRRCRPAWVTSTTSPRARTSTARAARTRTSPAGAAARACHLRAARPHAFPPPSARPTGHLRRCRWTRRTACRAWRVRAEADAACTSPFLASLS